MGIKLTEPKEQLHPYVVELRDNKWHVKQSHWVMARNEVEARRLVMDLPYFRGGRLGDSCYVDGSFALTQEGRSAR